LATTYSVGIEFSAKTQQLDQVVSKIQKFERDIGKLKGQNPFEGTDRGARNASKELDRVGQSAKGAAAGVGALRNALIGLGIGAFVKTIYSAAAEIERTKVQLKTLVGTAEGAERVFSQLQAINKQSPFELKDLTSAAAKLSAFGVSTEKLVDTTERLGKIAAGTGQSIDGIATAYGQVLAKGRLQGEELLQFQERGIDLGGELQRMLGLTKEEFADMTSKGKISAKLVEEAIKNMTGETGRFKDAFVNTANTLDAKLSNLQDAFFMAAGALGKAFEPIFKWMIDQLTTILNLVGDAISRWQGVQSLTPERVGQLRSQAGKDADAKYGLLNLSGDKQSFYNSQLDKYIDNEIKKVGKAVAPAVAAATAAPAPGRYTPEQIAANRALLGGDTSKPGSGGSSGTAKAAAEKAVQPLYISLVDLGKRLQAMGYTVKEHPSFGGVGQHSPNSYHYYGEALDVTDWRGGDWKGRTKGLINSLRGSGAGFAELLGPGDAGHDTHAHIAAQGGKVKLTDRLAQLLGLPSGGERGDQALGVMNQAFDEMVQKIEAARAAWERMKQGITDSNVLLKEQVTDQNEINRLVMEGLDPTAASEQVARQRELLNIHKEQAAALADLKGIEGLTTDEIKTKEAEINALYAERLRLQGQLNTGKDTASQLADAEKAKASTGSQAESDARGIAGTITGGLKDAIKAAISGGDVKAALSNMLAGLGEKFLDMAMRPLEDMLTNSFKGFLGGLEGAAKPEVLATQANTMALQNLTVAMQNAALAGGGGGGGGGILGGLGGLFGGGGGFSGAFSSSFGSSWGGFSGALSMPLLLADGGFVSSPTPALVGEGGSNEYVIPENKMGSAMARWNAGARGDAVVNGADPTGGAGGVATAEQPAQININGGVMQFNDTNYIRQDQLPSIIGQAGKMGEQRALRKLQMNPGTRRKLGMG
jgi:tape measure domain-containing protein